MTTRDRSTRAKVDAYILGRKAWGDQVPLNANPYESAPERVKWDSGWRAARADSLQDESMQGSS